MTGVEAMEHDDDKELEAIKARVHEMEEEAEKLKQLQSEVDKQIGAVSAPAAASDSRFLTLEQKVEMDGRSVYVGNVDYAATADELEQHFTGCGVINRVTILVDKFSGHPKGFAYVEFADKETVTTAMALDDSLFRGRQIKVMPKRTNQPGISTTNRASFRGGRGGGFRGRGAPWMPGSRGGFAMGYRPAFRARGFGMRGARRAYMYQPY